MLNFDPALVFCDGTAAPIDIKGYFKKTYGNQLQGKDWINCLSPDDKAALIHLLRERSHHGVMGGLARVANADRDEKGRFIKGDN